VKNEKKKEREGQGKEKKKREVRKIKKTRWGTKSEKKIGKIPGD